MLSARKNMDVVDAYARLGSYRAAGEVCGVDPKTVKRKVLAHEAGQLDDERAERAPVPKNTTWPNEVWPAKPPAMFQDWPMKAVKKTSMPIVTR